MSTPDSPRHIIADSVAIPGGYELVFNPGSVTTIGNCLDIPTPDPASLRFVVIDPYGSTDANTARGVDRKKPNQDEGKSTLRADVNRFRDELRNDVVVTYPHKGVGLLPPDRVFTRTVAEGLIQRAETQSIFRRVALGVGVTLAAIVIGGSAKEPAIGAVGSTAGLSIAFGGTVKAMRSHSRRREELPYVLEGIDPPMALREKENQNPASW